MKGVIEKNFYNKRIAEEKGVSLLLWSQGKVLRQSARD